MKFNYGTFLCLTVLLSSCGHKSEYLETRPEKKEIKVSTIQVSVQLEPDILRYSGSVEPSLTVPLSFKNTGTVEKVYVEEGDFVKRGQLLASLDKSDMGNIYRVALSRYQQAKDGYDRLKTVFEDGSLPEIKWVEMETGFEQAKASLEMAENNLAKCDLRAPSDGTIGKRSIEPGQSTLGLNLVHIELVELNTVNIKVSVPENEISKIKKGQQAVISVSALNSRKFEGKVNTISPVAEVISRTYSIKIGVRNSDHELKPGMVCDVALQHGNDQGILTVPYKAVSRDNEGNTFVFVVTPDKKRVRKQPVTVGNYHVSEIEILEGISEGQTIVNNGCEKLSDNSLISM